LRILLDAKDLIDIVEHGRPIDSSALRQWLRHRSASAVLSFTNVSDFVGPAFEENKFPEMRLLLQSLETLPLVYMREGTIIEEELRAALAAYRTGREPSAVNPFVARWDETAKWEGEAATKILVGMRLDDLVYMARGTIQAYKRAAPILRRQIEDERALPKHEKLSLKQIFVDGVSTRLIAHRIEAGGIDIESFGDWLWQMPGRCMGLRLHFEARHHLAKDHELRFQDGDIADFAHIAAIPYVDVVTVDKRIEDLVRKSLQTLRKSHLPTEPSCRVFRNVESLMRAYPSEG